MQLFDLCVDARMAHSGGIGTCIRSIAPLLNRPPFRVILLVNQLGESWCKDMEQILFSAPIYSLQEQALFPLKIPRCDLFWSPHYNIPLLPIRAKKRAVTIHDLCHFTSYCNASLLEKKAARWVMQKALRLSDCVATVSHFSKQELSRVFQNSPQIAVIPNGIDPILYTPQKKPILDLPSRFILFIGSGRPHKNRDGLLRAFQKLSFPEVTLVCVGTPIIKGERIISFAHVPDEVLPHLYSNAELFVFPSFYEGFGLPPLEAMSCGCPTIVSNTASLPEICGDASFYIDPTKPEELVNSMIRLITDPKQKKDLRLKGFERTKMFSWASTANLYFELFETTLR